MGSIPQDNRPPGSKTQRTNLGADCKQVRNVLGSWQDHQSRMKILLTLIGSLSCCLRVLASSGVPDTGPWPPPVLTNTPVAYTNFYQAEFATNQLLATGAGTTEANGIYTLMGGGYQGGLAYTNTSGKMIWYFAGDSAYAITSKQPDTNEETDFLYEQAQGHLIRYYNTEINGSLPTPVVAYFQPHASVVSEFVGLSKPLLATNHYAITVDANGGNDTNAGRFLGSFKTFYAASQFAQSGDAWFFAPGHYELWQATWTPINAFVSAQGAVFNDPYGYFAICPMGTFEEHGGTWLSATNSGPLFDLLNTVGNFFWLDGVTIHSRFGCIQAIQGAQLASTNDFVFKLTGCDISGGTYNVELLKNNQYTWQVYLADNYIHPNAEALPQFTIDSCIGIYIGLGNTTNDFVYLNGNTIALENFQYPSGRGIALGAQAITEGYGDNPRVFARGNIIDVTGSSSNTFQLNNIGTNFVLYDSAYPQTTNSHPTVVGQVAPPNALNLPLSLRGANNYYPSLEGLAQCGQIEFAQTLTNDLYLGEPLNNQKVGLRGMIVLTQGPTLNYQVTFDTNYWRPMGTGPILTMPTNSTASQMFINWVAIQTNVFRFSQTIAP